MELDTPRVRRVALAIITALAGLSYAWALGRDPLEPYYAAAVRSMSMSWHNFAFGAFDPGGTITLDKLPGAFWVQALAVRAFGVHTWAIVLPQAVEGAATVLVLYRAVRRLAGTAAGLIAALILAVSPATVALNRGNISDSLMILLLVLAADAVSGAIAGRARGSGRGAQPAAPPPGPGPNAGGPVPEEASDPVPEGEATGGTGPPGSTGRRGAARNGPDARRLHAVSGQLILAAVYVGLAFQAKMIEAWLVLPALGLAYLVSGPGRASRRVRQLAVAGVVAGLVSLAWMTAVSLVPAGHRPAVDGSSHDSLYEQVFVYNGFGRFSDQTPLQLLATQTPGLGLPAPGPAAGPARLFRGDLGRDTGWLLPAAVVGVAWGIASRRRRPRDDGPRACFVLWGGWLITLGVTFSVTTAINAYYTAALTPAVAAILGAGVAAAWSPGRNAGRTAGRRVGLAAVVAGTIGYAVWLVPATGIHRPGWLVPVVIAAGAAAIAALLGPVLLGAVVTRPVVTRPPAARPPATRGDRLFAAALAAGLGAALLAPAVAAAGLVAHHEGAFDTPFESPRQAGAIDSLFVQTPARVSVLIPQLEGFQNGAPDLMATQTAALASVFIYASGQEVLPIGGFTGTSPVPTLAQLRADIRAGRFHLVLAGPGTDPRLRWIAAHCQHVGRATPRSRNYYCVPADAG